MSKEYKPSSVTWNPIDTAPKDGCSLLLCTVYGIIEGYWSGSTWEQDVICSTGDSGAAGVRFEAYPTHWANMPDIPRSFKS